MQMLLEAGADARAMDINGCAPIQYLLKVTDVRPMAIPELCFQLLLNHNAARVYPPQFHKVERWFPTGSGLAAAVFGVALVFCAGVAVLPRLPASHRGPGQLLRALEAHPEVDGCHS